MTSSNSLTSPLPTQDSYVLLHGESKFLVPATIVPLDLHNSKLFDDWDLEFWELLGKLEWYRRPFVLELLHRQTSSSEKTFILLTRFADFPELLTECTDREPSLQENPLSIQIQAALTVEISEDGVTFYQKKLLLKLLWSRGLDRYAVVERESLLQALLAYKKNLEAMKQNLPIYEPKI